MFPLLTFAQLRPLHSRLFTVSSALEKYKMKTHSGAKKRWQSLPNGTFKRGKTGHRHKNQHKSSVAKNRLGQIAHSNESQTHRLKKQLLPYGTG